MSDRSLLSCRIVVLLSGTRGTCYIAREVPGIGLAEAILEQAIRFARHMQLSTPHWCGTLCLSSACSYQVESPKKQQAACSRENIRSRLGLLSNLNFYRYAQAASGQQQPVAQPARDRSRLSNPGGHDGWLPVFRKQETARRHLSLFERLVSLLSHHTLTYTSVPESLRDTAAVRCCRQA